MSELNTEGLSRNERVSPTEREGSPEEQVHTQDRIQSALEGFGENVMYINGREPGPSIFILGGVHGNEATGILVADALRRSFESGERTLERGSVRLALGNTEAIRANSRWIDGRDLNRYFADAVLTGGTEESFELRRARTLSGVIDSSDITIDIHATNRPSVPFVSAKADVEHERVYRWFSKEAVLEDPCFVLGGEPVTTDEYADSKGNIGICIESGQADDVSKVDSVLKSVYALMNDLAMLEKAPENLPLPTPAPVFTMTRAIVLDSRGFRFAPGKAGYSFEAFKRGEVIAYQGESAIVAEYDGVFVFPKAEEHRVMGSPVCYLAVSKTQTEEKSS